MPRVSARMDPAGNNTTTIDDYIEACRAEVREALQTLRETIAAEAPGARETICYRMPTFVLNGNLVHFAAFDTHIGFYPTPSAITAFASELAPYKTSKGAVRFPLGEPLPLPLIRRMVRFRVTEQKTKRERP